MKVIKAAFLGIHPYFSPIQAGTSNKAMLLALYVASNWYWVYQSL
jgi:hypothetical protein